MPHPITATYRFLRGDGSLTVAVGILVFFVFGLWPLAELGLVGRVPVALAFFSSLGLGAWFVFEPRPLMRAFLIALALAFLVRMVNDSVDSLWLDVADAITTIGAAGLLATLLLVRVLRDGRINVHRISGAIGTFLLLGIMFAQGYRLLVIEIPGSFSFGGAPATAAELLPRLGYFSFITLTSVGFGDIAPLHPFARSLVVLEALVGQLFLAILVARLVGMEIEWRQELRRRERDAEREASAPRG